MRHGCRQHPRERILEQPGPDHRRQQVVIAESPNALGKGVIHIAHRGFLPQARDIDSLSDRATRHARHHECPGVEVWDVGAQLLECARRPKGRANSSAFGSDEKHSRGARFGDFRVRPQRLSPSRECGFELRSSFYGPGFLRPTRHSIDADKHSDARNRGKAHHPSPT